MKKKKKLKYHDVHLYIPLVINREVHIRILNTFKFKKNFCVFIVILLIKMLATDIANII